MPNLNKNNGAENKNGLHEEVVERLTWWAEKNGKTMNEAVDEFNAYLLAELGVVDAKAEEEDLLIEAAETFIVERRVMSGGTSNKNAVELVGYFVGVDPKVRDGQERRRAPAVSAALDNLDDAIQSGLVARAYTESGVWMLEKKDGEVVKTEESADAKPWFLF